MTTVIKGREKIFLSSFFIANKRQMECARIMAIGIWGC